MSRTLLPALLAFVSPSDDGGLLVLAKIMQDAEEEVVPEPVRMVFVPNTAPAQAVANCGTDDILHVLGIPRINLERISFMTSQQPGQPFQAKLPYEIIVVGIYSDSSACSGAASSGSPS